MRGYLFSALLIIIPIVSATTAVQPLAMDHIDLPKPLEGQDTFERVLQSRRSVREYADQPVKLADLSQMLWAAQGISDPRGLRNAPSAGALYPLEIYILCTNVSGLPAGIYHYVPAKHGLNLISEGDYRDSLASAALGQGPVAAAPLVFVIAAEYQRTTWKYGQRGRRYVHMEVGHAGQNLLLQATSLGLSGLVIGAFDDVEVANILKLPDSHEPLYLMPVGHAAQSVID